MSAAAIKALTEEVAELRRELEELRRPRREYLEAFAQDPAHQEHPDPIPLEAPIGYERPPTLTEQIQQQVRIQVSQLASEHELGTFEEEDDFKPEDEDLLPLSGYEVYEYEMEDELDVVDPAPPSFDAEPPKDPPEAGEAPPGAVQEPPVGGEQSEPAPGSPAPQ